MESRRDFLKVSVGAVTLAGARPLFGFQGANNRIRMGVIGMGGRSARVFDSLTRQPDCQFLVGCEVSQTKLQNFQAPNRPLAQIPIVGDYRKVLERNDIDAVLIATPDFSHSRIMVDAIAAGKDVYVEKPVSNSIPRINAMLEAYTKSNRVVQVGTHQRSWDHFIEAKKILDSGILGPVNHVVIQQGGNYAAMKQEPVPVPAGLDWDAWQVDAPKKPFKQGYTGFRAWQEYGSGLVGDWGAHHVDVANWFMNADEKQPLKTAAIGFFARQNIDPECVYDSFSISWQFDTHLVTFENSEIPRPQDDIEGWGVYFLGPNGTLQINRMGYAVRPYVAKTQRKQGPPPIPGAGNVQGVAGTPPAAGAAGGAGGAGAGRGAGRGGRGGGPAIVPVTANIVVNPKGGVEEDYPLDVHTRNFLDCVKSRNRKTNAPMEVGYNSALPCLLALESMVQNRVLAWDPVARKSKPV
jgi:predicted dehydrogenase